MEDSWDRKHYPRQARLRLDTTHLTSIWTNNGLRPGLVWGRVASTAWFFLRFLTCQGGKKWRRVKWHSEQAFNSSRIKLSLIDGPAVYFSLRFHLPSLDSHRRRQQCGVHHPSSTFRGYIGFFSFSVVSAYRFYFYFFCLPPALPSPPTKSHQSHYCVLEPTSAPGLYFFTPFNLSYFFHTCSIIATIWTKQALQRCNKKKTRRKWVFLYSWHMIKYLLFFSLVPCTYYVY